MLAVLLKWMMTFAATVLLHVVVWRICRPQSYGAWIPLLQSIFVAGGLVIAMLLVRFVHIAGEGSVGGPMTQWLAIAVLQTVVGIVYTFGYTLLLAGSPSLAILWRLSRSPDGLRVEEIGMPLTAEALIDLRIRNLTQSRMIESRDDVLLLAPKGRRLTGIVIFYRRLIGLPEGGGG